MAYKVQGLGCSVRNTPAGEAQVKLKHDGGRSPQAVGPKHEAASILGGLLD